MGSGIFKDELSRRDAMKTGLKAGAYAAPVILAASVPGIGVAAASPGPGGPTITGVNPQGGPTTGGTVVTLTGTNFCPGATVTVNGVAAVGVTVVNATTITFTTPPGTVGAGTITGNLPTWPGDGHLHLPRHHGDGRGLWGQRERLDIPQRQQVGRRYPAARRDEHGGGGDDPGHAHARRD